jgi:hypothetical protein
MLYTGSDMNPEALTIGQHHGMVDGIASSISENYIYLLPNFKGINPNNIPYAEVATIAVEGL